MAKYDKNMEYVSQTQTLIGQQRKRLVDQDTGEVIEVDQITKRALGQKQFWKVYLMDFLQVLGGFEYKQLDVLIYILEHTEAANNTFIGTYRSLEKNVGVSYDTVAKTIKTLITKGFLTKVSNGVYQVKPTIMMKGSEHKKSLLLNYYDDGGKAPEDEQLDGQTELE
jgi:predicted transcriptional regulator